MPGTYRSFIKKSFFLITYLVLICFQLTIHVGLKVGVSCFTLEKRAERFGYKDKDVDGQPANNQQHALPGPDVLYTTLDVDKICKDFNDCKRKMPDPELRAASSTDAEK